MIFREYLNEAVTEILQKSQQTLFLKDFDGMEWLSIGILLEWFFLHHFLKHLSTMIFTIFTTHFFSFWKCSRKWGRREGQNGNSCHRKGNGVRLRILMGFSLWKGMNVYYIFSLFSYPDSEFMWVVYPILFDAVMKCFSTLLQSVLIL